MQTIRQFSAQTLELVIGFSSIDRLVEIPPRINWFRGFRCLEFQDWSSSFDCLRTRLRLRCEDLYGDLETSLLQQSFVPANYWIRFDSIRFDSTRAFSFRSLWEILRSVEWRRVWGFVCRIFVKSNQRSKEPYEFFSCSYFLVSEINLWPFLFFFLFIYIDTRKGLDLGFRKTVDSLCLFDNLSY